MRTLLFTCLLTAVISGIAQDTIHKGKLQYFGLHQASLLAGSSSEKMSVLTTNGIRNGNWYGGISTGIDWYGIRSIPLLASIHKAFSQGRHQPFIYGNAGIEFPWMEDYELVSRFGMINSYNYKTGFSSEGGIGYFINLKNKTALSLSAGFSYKQMNVQETVNQVGVEPFLNTNIYDYKIYYRRIAIRIGVKI